MTQDLLDPPLPSAAMAVWLQLMAQAMKGTQEAQKAFAIMSRSPEAMAGFQQWLALFAPGMEMPTTISQPEVMTEWLESWQKAMGVVPRTRYLELLEKADALERRVRELEDMNRHLKTMLEGRKQQAESTQAMAKLWGQMVENGFKNQAAWMEAWTIGEDYGALDSANNLDEEE